MTRPNPEVVRDHDGGHFVICRLGRILPAPFAIEAIESCSSRRQRHYDVTALGDLV